MKPRHGLVIGKFYPPHAGHHLLVRVAARTCELVTVEVLASGVESIPLQARVAWMQEAHRGEANVTVVGAMDDVRVDYADPEVWQAHVDIMRRTAASVNPHPVDAVFTSEAYGEELAQRLGARHVCVDASRVIAPVSGTAVRKDPVAFWPLLTPAVRAYFARRVVLVGAESTGKTTLAQSMAEALCARGGAHALTRWVPEYGRDHATDKWLVERAVAALEGRPAPDVSEVAWRSEDFTVIARTQQQHEDFAAREGGPVLVCDTDAFATSIWHERYLQSRSPSVEAVADANRPSLYLLTHHDDVPFTQDGTRDGERIRAWMTGCFEERLRSTGRPFVILRGDRQERRAQALAAVDSLLKQGWKLAAPLG